MFFRTASRCKRPSIAVQNSFPKQGHTAENEFVRRLQLCAERLSIEVYVVDCSADVAATAVDFLLSLHEVSPKLTPTLTIGALWNPPSGIRRDPIRCNFVGSFDGYLSASRSVTGFITEQIARFSGVSKPIADFRFFPTSPSGIAQATSYGSLAYLGVHWDGARHGDFLDQLTRDGLLTVYGPQSAWRHAGSAYRGGIPFDGTSVIRRLAEHGIVLCLHRDPHVAEDTPSMRLFEAASAGCLILSDAIPFAAETFGDTIFVLPDGEGRTDFVREKLAWARANPGRARDMAQASKAIFEQHCSLDVLLPKVVNFSQEIERRYSDRKSLHRLFRWPDRIDVICDLRDSQGLNLEDAIAIANVQIHRSIRILVLRTAGHKCSVKPRIRPRPGVCVTEIFLTTAQSPWAALGLISSPSRFVTKLNAKTTWAAWHLSSLARALQSTKGPTVALSSSVISVSEDSLAAPPNFSGELSKQVSENSILITEDYESHPEKLKYLRIEDLLTRSDWLICAAHIQNLASRAEDDERDQGEPTIQTGLVTCFVQAKTAMGLRPVTFS